MEVIRIFALAIAGAMLSTHAARAEPILGRSRPSALQNAADTETAASLRVFQNEQSGELLILPINIDPHTQIDFAQVDYEWAGESLRFLRDDVSPALLEGYLKAVSQHYDTSWDSGLPIESFDAIQAGLNRFSKAEANLTPLPCKSTRMRAKFTPLPTRIDRIKESVGWTTPVHDDFEIETPTIGLPPAMGWTDPIRFPDFTPICLDSPVQQGLSQPSLQPSYAPLPAVIASSGFAASLPCSVQPYISKSIPAALRWGAGARLEALYTRACHRGLTQIAADGPYPGDGFAQFLAGLGTFPHRLMTLPVVTLTFDIRTEPQLKQSAIMNSMNLENTWSWAKIARTQARSINRPQDLVIDRLGPATAQIEDRVLKVTVPLTYYGAMGLVAPDSSEEQFVAADVSIWTENDTWFLDAIGLNLQFTFDPEHTNSIDNSSFH